MNDEHGDFSVSAARAAGERDELGDWVARFLSSPGSDNAALAGLLSTPPRCWLGPIELPIDHLNRLAGPPGTPAMVIVDDDEWRDDVADLTEKIEQDEDPPPVVVSYQNGQLVLEDGNHRVEGLRRAGEQRAWAVVAFDDEETRARFVAPSPA